MKLLRISLPGLCLVLIIGLFIIAPTPAYALEPSDNLSIHSVMAVRNLAEDGDMAIVFHYEIEYTGDYPEIPATSSFTFRLFGEDGALLAVSSPYVFYAFGTNGYGDGISSFYFTANDGHAWGAAYQINILGLPAYFDPIQTLNYTMNADDYSAAELQADSQSAFYDYIMLLINSFELIYTEVSLKATTDIGVVLSSYGESYFRGTIPGIQFICPALFYIQVLTPEQMEVQTYTMTLGETYTEKLVGTDLMRGAERLGTHIGGISGAFVFGILAFCAAIGLCIFTMQKGWGIEPGLIGSTGIVIVGTLLIGNFFFTLTMIGGLVAGMAIMFIFAYKRA